MPPFNRAETKIKLLRLKGNTPNHSKHHYEQRMHSLAQMYRCVVYREKFGLSANETAERLNVRFARVYELLRAFDRSR